MEFSRQEYWSGCHFLLQGIFLTQGWNPCVLCLLDSLPLVPPGKPLHWSECLFYVSTTIFFFLAAPCSMLDLVPWSGIKPVLPAMEAQSLNHWTPQRSPSSITILQLCHSFEIDSLPLFFLFKIVLSILGPLRLHRNFKVSFLFLQKKTPQNWDFNRNCIDSVNQFGQYCHVNVTFSDPWHVISFI